MVIWLLVNGFQKNNSDIKSLFDLRSTVSQPITFDNLYYKILIMKRLLSLTIICLLFASFTSCSGGNKNGNSNSADNSPNFRADTISVTVMKVQSKDFIQSLQTTGTMYAQKQATVRTKVSGEIKHVYVNIGDCVQKGDLLMKIQPTDFKLKLQQAKAALANAKATLDNSRIEMKRMKGLYKAGSATEQNKDQAVTAFEQAKATYQMKLAAKNIARQQLDYTSIQAPFSGVVTKRSFKQGDYASAAQPAVQITNLSVMEAKINLPAQYAGNVKKGIPVTLHFHNQFHSVTGKVTAVNPKIDTDSRTFLVKVTVDNSDQPLPDGLFFKADFKLPELRDKPAVPAKAIQKDQGQDILWIIKNGRAHRQVVAKGPENGNWVMIRQGVKIGETIAVNGVSSLIDDYPVKTTAADSLSTVD